VVPTGASVGRACDGEAMSDMADDLLSGVPMNQVLRDLAARKVATVAMTGDRPVRCNGKAAEHGGWNSRTVRQILTHSRMSGHAVYKGRGRPRRATRRGGWGR
jgi:site-specific DNA recombinase